MVSLWGDGWFYLSGGGFLLSCLLFVFLLGQYRSAIEAEEDGEESAPPAAEKVYVPRPIEPISRIQEPMPSIDPAPAPTPIIAAAAPPEKKKSESTASGGLSPAVVYLQSLKAQIDHLDAEMLALKALASQQAAQGELILSRLEGLGQRLEAVEAPASGSEPSSAPSGDALARKATDGSEPSSAPSGDALARKATGGSEPSSAPSGDALARKATGASEPSPAPSGDALARGAQEVKTVVLHPPVPEPTITTSEPPVAEASPESEPASLSEPKPARKGPVWPI